jgi:pectate lyase
MKRALMLMGLWLIASAAMTWAELPANEQWREGMISEHMGFGNPTGGKGTTLCTVTNLNESGAGSLHACAFDGNNRWVIFAVSGTINLNSVNINLGSNVTIDGRGADITISGTATPMFWINSVSNVIITNLKFINTAQTAIDVRDSFELGSHDFWFDHLTFAQIGDEAIGVDCANEGGPGLPGITISWSHFTDNGQPGGLLLSYALIVDVPDLSCQLATQFTLHHNYYNERMRRNPVTRQAKVHGFNNYHKNTQLCGSPPCMAVDVREQGQYYSENEIFECAAAWCGVGQSSLPPPYVNDRWPRIVTTNLGGEGAPNNTKRTGTWSVTGEETYEADLNPSTIFNPSSFYSYTLEPANAALRDAIVRNAGWLNCP